MATTAALATGQATRTRRTRGQRPDGAIFVGYGTEWASRFRAGGYYAVIAGQPHPVRFPYSHPAALPVKDAEHAAALYAEWLAHSPAWQKTAAQVLRGYDLECDCALDEPCHADALLAAANK